MIDFDPSKDSPPGFVGEQAGRGAAPYVPPGKKRRRRRGGRGGGGWLIATFLALALFGLIVAAGVAGAVFWKFSRDLPKIITVQDYHPLGVTRLLGDGGKDNVVLDEFYEERRYVIPYEKIPDSVVKAFISAEDDTFFQHSGFNVLSIIRASIANFRAGHAVQGGSTITQQVAKSLLLTPEKSLGRKVKELILSSRIEHNLTKQQILYLYLNQIYLGHHAYGVQAAARTYFHKDISELTVAEAAILAGLPQAPSKYSPVSNPKRAKERQLYVLKRMYENSFIGEAQMKDAAAQQIRIYHDEEEEGSKGTTYLTESIRKYLVEKYGDKAVYQDGLTVSVPTNPTLEATAAKSLHEGLSAVDKRIGYRGPLQHLKTPDEIKSFEEEERDKLIDAKLPYRLLMADGQLDALQAMRLAGIGTEAQLLPPGEGAQAVVTGFDESRKAALLQIGDLRAELPIEGMKWAHGVRDEKTGAFATGEPATPSKVLSAGDVILVRVASNDAKGISVSLDQEPVIQGALFSIEAQTGYVLAMEGGYDFGQSEFNRAMQAVRQPGSSFKPIIYAAALERGYTPASIIVDSPIVYENGDDSKWKPSNFEEKFYGDTTFRQALIKSRNVPTIKIVQSIQIPYLIDYAKRLGFTNTQFPMDLSISLGSAGATLFDLTRVYALFARLGRKVTPIFLTRVVDRDGKILEERTPQAIPAQVKIPPPTEAAVAAVAVAPGAPPETVPGKPTLAFPAYPLADDPDQVLDPRVAYVMSHLMKEVVSYGTGYEAKAIGRPAAGKTGTTNDYIDAWFMGFTPHVVTGVWVGFDNPGRSIGPGETGARAALPIWLSYMKEAVKPYPDTDFTIPPGVSFASIDPATGKLASPNSSRAIKEAFIEGTQPTQPADSSGVSSETQNEFFKEDVE